MLVDSVVAALVVASGKVVSMGFTICVESKGVVVVLVAVASLHSLQLGFDDGCLRWVCRWYGDEFRGQHLCSSAGQKWGLLAMIHLRWRFVAPVRKWWMMAVAGERRRDSIVVLGYWQVATITFCRWEGRSCSTGLFCERGWLKKVGFGYLGCGVWIARVVAVYVKPNLATTDFWFLRLDRCASAYHIPIFGGIVEGLMDYASVASQIRCRLVRLLSVFGLLHSARKTGHSYDRASRLILVVTVFAVTLQRGSGV